MSIYDKMAENLNMKIDSNLGEIKKLDKRYLEIEANYLKKTEKARRRINTENDIKAIALIGIETIAELTGDKLFLDMNRQKIRGNDNGKERREEV